MRGSAGANSRDQEGAPLRAFQDPCGYPGVWGAVPQREYCISRTRILGYELIEPLKFRPKSWVTFLLYRSNKNGPRKKFAVQSGKKKTNKHKHFRRDGVRDKQEPSLGQMGPLLGTEWDPSLGQTGLSLLNSTVKSPFCPVCPWDGWGFVPGTIVPQGPSAKCLCVFCLLVFFAPHPTLSLKTQPRNRAKKFT